MRIIKNNTIPEGLTIFPNIDIIGHTSFDDSQYYIRLRTHVPVIEGDDIYLNPIILHTVANNKPEDIDITIKDSRSRLLQEVIALQNHLIPRDKYHDYFVDDMFIYDRDINIPRSLRWELPKRV